MADPIQRLKEAQLSRLLIRLERDAEHYEGIRVWLQANGCDEGEYYAAICRASGGLDALMRLVRHEIDQRRGKVFPTPTPGTRPFYAGMP